MNDHFFSQLLALCAFFAFPTFQYIFLKVTSRGEGKPELWYLPAYGFRLVMRNIPRKRTFYNIRYNSRIREILPSCVGSSVGSFKDCVILNESDFFLLPGADQILLEFTVKRDNDNQLCLIKTKVGKPQDRYVFSIVSDLIVDYEAMLNNWFHFDVRVARRVTISGSDLQKAIVQIEREDKEQEFKICKTNSIS